MRRTSINVWVLATVLPLLAGCPGSTLKKELSGIKQTIDTARKNGAYLCAPVELAMAESHYDFTAADLYYGDYFSAKDHIAITKDNADKALAKSPADRCAYKEERAVIVPKSGDADGDGIKDELDKCPDEPEDKDGFEDQDGCPDPDNDKDSILDKDDQCPNEPETYNGYQDQDGCPDKGRVIVRKGKLEILDKIYFETDKDIIKEISYPILDAIAATLKGNPQILEIEVQGHADERGDDAHNMDLTERRAKAVKVYLIEKGIDGNRLQSHGYGETKPVCPEHNEDCWSRNRRVEFVILKRSDGDTKE